MELLSRYNEEITNDLNITPFNINEKQLGLPARKHYWVVKLIEQKEKLPKLEKRLNEMSKEVAKKITDEARTSVDPKTLNIMIKTSNAYQSLNQEIKDCKLLIEYLEKVERIFNSVTFDMKNMIALMQLERA